MTEINDKVHIEFGDEFSNNLYEQLGNELTLGLSEKGLSGELHGELWNELCVGLNVELGRELGEVIKHTLND